LQEIFGLPAEGAGHGSRFTPCIEQDRRKKPYLARVPDLEPDLETDLELFPFALPAVALFLGGPCIFRFNSTTTTCTSLLPSFAVAVACAGNHSTSPA
jgi:hypothetical protein